MDESETTENWTKPRNVVSKDEYYIKLAELIATKSKDPITQCGAIIVSKDNRPISMGYNGPPRCISDELINWNRPKKYPYIIHSETNAIFNTAQTKDLMGAILYVNNKPCPNCMLNMASVGISRVVFLEKPPKKGSSINDINWELAKDIARKANMTLEKFENGRTEKVQL